jgi:hypothetical protein
MHTTGSRQQPGSNGGKEQLLRKFDIRELAADGMQVYIIIKPLYIYIYIHAYIHTYMHIGREWCIE